jgi:hypothetical protein
MMSRHLFLFQLFAGVAALTLATGGMSERCFATTILLGNPVPLSTLVGNVAGQVVAGDKVFTDFTYTPTGDMPAASGVNVIPIQDDAGNFGIRYQGFFTDMASTQGGSDALITYNVGIDAAHLAQGYKISDAHLAGNPVLPDPARRGFIGVTETFLPIGTNSQYTMTIYDDEQKPVPKLADQTVFVPAVTSLSVQKDIGAFAFVGFATPTMSFVDQTYSQIKVPETTTMVLSLIGIVGLAVFMRQLDASRRFEPTVDV